MSGIRLGKAWVKVNGQLLETMPGAKIDIGGVERKPVVGNNAVLGYSETPRPSMVECEIALGPNTSLTDLAKATDATITFECDTGQTYIVREAFITEPPAATDGEGGKVPLKYAGQPAEEMK